MSEQPLAIVTKKLTKCYGDITAVRDLNLEIRRGEIFGLLGPNGAGKTTTTLMLLGLTEPTAGQALLEGLDPVRKPLEVKRFTGYLPDNVGFYDHLTAWANLEYTAAMNHMTGEDSQKRIQAALEQVGLAEAGRRKVREFSRGMKQRLGIADIIVKDPQIVILDEPTLGIDPEGVRDILGLIVFLAREKGKTILVSSHLLHQMQEICDRLGIFVGGRLMATGSLAALGQHVLRGKSMEIEIQADPDDEHLLEVLRSIDGVTGVYRQGVFVRLICADGVDVRPELAPLLTSKGITLLYLRTRGYDLDDIYKLYFQGEKDHGTLA